MLKARLSLSVLPLVVTLLVGLVAPTLPAAPAPEARMLLALTTGEVETLESRLIQAIPRLAAHYAAQGRALRTVVVIHGEAYRFFLTDLAGTPYASDAALRARQAALHQALEKLAREHGVRFEICEAGMRKRGLRPENVLPFAVPTPSAVVSLVDWQNRGYAYVPLE